MLFSCLQASKLSILSRNSSCESLVEKRNVWEKAEPVSPVSTAPQMLLLRALMVKENIAALIVNSSDAHGSEEVAEVDQRLMYMSNFTGQGLAVITLTNAYVFTDSRFYISGRKELDSLWELKEERDPTEFLKDVKGSVGVNATLLSSRAAQHYLDNGVNLVRTDGDLVDKIWINQPKRQMSMLNIHPLRYSGESARSKLDRLIQPGKNIVLYTLAEIAWLLNLRTWGDIPCSPVFRSYFLLCSEPVLYIQAERLSSQVSDYLENLGVKIKNYDEIFGDLTSVHATVDSSCSWALSYSIKKGGKTIVTTSSVALAMCIKNPVEISGARQAYLLDGTAFVKHLAWLEERIKSKDDVTEWECSSQISSLRAESDEFVGEAYSNIIAVGPNSASPHYAPSKADSPLIKKNLIYLNDTGGNYRMGTCDTTRTLHFGKPTEFQKDVYTAVLQGHIEMSSVVLPKGTIAGNIDCLARKYLWRMHLDYGHGTGHGIGSFLNVHEQPPNISLGSQQELKAGMITSIEPGYYKEDVFGVRIESVYLVVEKDGWLSFERLTQVPIQEKMIQWNQLTKSQTSWLKAHNNNVRQCLTPRLHGDKRTLKWLRS